MKPTHTHFKLRTVPLNCLLPLFLCVCVCVLRVCVCICAQLHFPLYSHSCKSPIWRIAFLKNCRGFAYADIFLLHMSHSKRLVRPMTPQNVTVKGLDGEGTPVTKRESCAFHDYWRLTVTISKSSHLINLRERPQ